MQSLAGLESIESIECEDFDEDAQLQADMWNMLVRRGDNDDDKFKVSATRMTSNSMMVTERLTTVQN